MDLSSNACGALTAKNLSPLQITRTSRFSTFRLTSLCIGTYKRKARATNIATNRAVVLVIFLSSAVHTLQPRSLVR